MAHANFGRIHRFSPSETVEFERLDKLRRHDSTKLPFISAERHLQQGKRWLELFEKHEVARSAMIEARRATKH